MTIGLATTPEAQKQRADKEGWGYDGSIATEQEVLQTIYALVRVEKPLILVETGTHTGAGTQAMLQGCRDNGRGHIWTIEYLDTEFVPTDGVTFVRGDSRTWDAPDEIDFLFLDCGEPEVRIAALTNLWPKVRPGGLVLVHDVCFYDEEFLQGLESVVGPPGLVLPALNGLALWRKVGEQAEHG